MTAPGVERGPVIVHDRVHPATDRGTTTRAPGVPQAPILVTRGEDPLHIHPEMITDPGEIAALTIHPNGEDRETVCGSGHRPMSPTGFPPPEPTATGRNQAMTTGSDSGAKVHPGGNHHRRGRELVLPPQLKLRLRQTGPRD